MRICRLIGAIYGRMVGLSMVYMFGVTKGDILWAWIDPGAMALIGAASFFGGVSRLTMSLTVIMVGDWCEAMHTVYWLNTAREVRLWVWSQDLREMYVNACSILMEIR